jgi:hypothetical protein
LSIDSLIRSEDSTILLSEFTTLVVLAAKTPVENVLDSLTPVSLDG